MKNVYLLIVFLVLFACSSSDDNNSDDSIYNPPSWIHGTWGLEATQITAEQPFYRFTSNNVCQIQPGVAEVCWKELIEQFPGQYSGSDSSSNTIYEASFISSPGLTVTIKFQRVSATTILWIENGGVTGDVELVKLD